jgi:AraC-like DNA-binding protein
MHATGAPTWTKRRGAATACVFAFVARVVARTRCPEHAHPCAEIVHVGRSGGTLYQDGVAHRFVAGSVFLYQPGAPHWVDHLRPGEHTCLGVVGAAVGAVAPGVWTGQPSLERLFAECRRAVAGDERFRQRRLDRLADLVVCDLAELPPLETIAPLPPARRARAIIDSQPAQDLPLADLAELVGVSTDYLRHVFRRDHGIPPHAYRLRRRLEQARALLVDPARSVGEIAEAVGFTDAFYFSRAFSRAFGLAPTAWRARRAR